ncbi:transcriptional regulator, TraR/DksA family [Actinobacteria bacterium OK074]|nr:transcriptional regulator, TraR/DksA family [Actinobacteria bacterium OK074]
MVAKKTAVQQSASGRSTGASGGSAAMEARPKKSAHGASGGRAKSAATEAPARKTASKKSVVAEPGAKKRAGSGTAAKKGADSGTAVKGSAGPEAAAEKAPVKKTAAKKAAPEESAARKAAATKRTPAKSAARKITPTEKITPTKSAAKKSTAKKAGAAKAAKQTGATTVVAKKTRGTATAAKNLTAVPKARLAAVEPGELAVRPGEDPWTPDEVAEARAELQADAMRLGSEISSSEQAIVGLMRDSGDGAGDDQADTGTKNITREHEMALAANARETLEQTERALERLDSGTYGLCENCGNPIGKARMQAFPRATLCVECKQKQERRY